MTREFLSKEQIEYLTTFFRELESYDMDLGTDEDEKFAEEAMKGDAAYFFINPFLGVEGSIRVGYDSESDNFNRATVKLSIFPQGLPKSWLERIASDNGVEILEQQASKEVEYGLGFKGIPVFPKDGQPLTVEDLVGTYFDKMATTIRDVEKAQETISHFPQLQS